MMKPGVPSRMPPRDDVVAQEGERRMAGQLQQPGAAAALAHLARGVGGVAVDGLEVIGDVAVGVVLQLAAQLADRSVDTVTASWT